MWRTCQGLCYVYTRSEERGGRSSGVFMFKSGKKQRSMSMWSAFGAWSRPSRFSPVKALDGVLKTDASVPLALPGVPNDGVNPEINKSASSGSFPDASAPTSPDIFTRGGG